jgi:hypothetical protein
MLVLTLLAAGGCFNGTLTPSAQMATPVVNTATTTGTALAWTNESELMYGICFEAAFDAAGRIFVLRSADELNELFNLADNSQLCRRPVTRATYDFDGGRVLVGLWSRGRGCTARHEVRGLLVDEATRSVTVNLAFITEGDCNYELVRPFWIGISGVPDYAITMVVE